MADIFISYVEEDGDVAAELARGIEDAGYSAWYHERDSVPGPSYLIQFKHVGVPSNNMRLHSKRSRSGRIPGALRENALDLAIEPSGVLSTLSLCIGRQGRCRQTVRRARSCASCDGPRSHCIRTRSARQSAECG